MRFRAVLERRRTSPAGRRSDHVRLAVLSPLLLLAAVIAGCTSGAQAAAAPLEFGIYPGGPVGTRDFTDAPVPENPAARLAALVALRAEDKNGEPRPFVVRLYDSFTGTDSDALSGGSGANATVDSEIDGYTAQGFDVDLVVRFEPSTQLGSQAVDDYLEFVRSVVQRYGPNPQVQFLQIANEINITSSSSSSDGAYSGAVQALVWGVEAAAQTAKEDGYRSLKVGYNWAYAQGTGTDTPLWAFIRSQGESFRTSVSWVGLDDYPGTFTDTTSTPAATGRDLVDGVARLRALMERGGIPRSVPIHVTETGYPTGSGRGQSAQSTALSSLVHSVDQVRARYGVSDLEWFDLRDSNSSVQDRQEQYGLMTDDYRPKTAFATYRSLVAELGR